MYLLLLQLDSLTFADGKYSKTVFEWRSCKSTRNERDCSDTFPDIDNLYRMGSITRREEPSFQCLNQWKIIRPIQFINIHFQSKSKPLMDHIWYISQEPVSTKSQTFFLPKKKTLKLFVLFQLLLLFTNLYA